MTSGGSTKKKKRKAAKKKKKKQQHDKNKCKGINIHSPPTTLQQEHDDLETHYTPIHNGGGETGLNQERIGCSSVGSQFMEGSGNDGGEKKVDTEEEEVVEVVKDLDHGGGEIVEKVESLEDEGVPEKSAYDDPVEKVISSVSEEMNQLVQEVPVVEETVSTFVEAIPVEKMKESGIHESISKEVEDRGISLDLPRVEDSHETEEESKEPDEEPENVPIVPPVLKRSTWKSCCGLFE